jgi:hypothetical protein
VFLASKTTPHSWCQVSRIRVEVFILARLLVVCLLASRIGVYASTALWVRLEVYSRLESYS